jgi:predicted nucleic acid-binding protein
VIYLDTSYLVRLYFEDPGFEAVRALAGSDHVSCAWHGHAESMAAFHRKFREKVIRSSQYKAVMEQFISDQGAGAVTWLPAGPEVLEKVSEVYADLPSNIYLRAADALHLATAALHGHSVIYSNDTHLLVAAAQFNLVGRNVIPQGK